MRVGPIGILLLCCCVIFSSVVGAEGTNNTHYEAGKQYLRLEPAMIANPHIQQLIAENPGKLQVIEFFSYACFWCWRLRPFIDEWVTHKPDTVVYYQFPVSFNKKWEVLAKAYYIAKALGKTKELEPKFFEDIQQKHIDLSDEKLLAAFFVHHGVSEKQFQYLYRSFTVNRELKQANDLANAYHISVSPVIILNAPSGSYLLNAKLAGSEQELITLLNYLVSREAKTLAGG